MSLTKIPNSSDLNWRNGEIQAHRYRLRTQPNTSGDVLMVLDGKYNCRLHTARILESDGFAWATVELTSLGVGFIAQYRLDKPNDLFYAFTKSNAYVEFDNIDVHQSAYYWVDLLGMTMVVDSKTYDTLLNFHKQIVIGLENAQRTPNDSGEG